MTGRFFFWGAKEDALRKVRSLMNDAFMGTLNAVIFIFSMSWANAMAGTDLNSLDALQIRCQSVSAPELTRESFQWDYSLMDLIAKAVEIRASPLRLADRAIFDENKKALVLPWRAEFGGPVRLPANLIRSVQRHVEEALRLGYVDGIFFPDMGHTHLLIPQKTWDEVYSKIPAQEQTKKYELFFADPEVKIFYHTAEQLKMIDSEGNMIPDRRIQWRWFSRNLAGDNRGEGRLELLQNHKSPVNTVSGVPGYRWWGAGFYLSEHNSGCIAFQHEGQIRYFDLSFRLN